MTPGKNAQDLLAVLEEGKTYYLIEESVPAGYKKDETVRTVRVVTGPDTYTDLKNVSKEASDVFDFDQDGKPVSQKIAFNWSEGVKLLIGELGVEDSEEDAVIADPSTHEEKVLTAASARRYYVLKNDAPVVFQTEILNIQLTDISILKVGGNGTTGLRGAVFQLYSVSDDGHEATLAKGIGGIDTVQKTVGGEQKTFESAFESDGTLHTLTGMPNGAYKLIEVVVPDGYVNALPDINITVSDRVIYSITTSDKIRLSDNRLAVTIVNTPGTELPQTGGPGTLAFKLIGSILTVFAGAFLVRRRRAA